MSLTCDAFKLDRARLASDIARTIDGFRKNETEMPGVSNAIVDLLDRGWHYATLFCGETQIRTGHILLGGLKSSELRRAFTAVSQEFGKIAVDQLTGEYGKIWSRSDEENMRPMDGSGTARCGNGGRRGRGRPARPDRARPLLPGSDRQGRGRDNSTRCSAAMRKSDY